MLVQQSRHIQRRAPAIILVDFGNQPLPYVGVHMLAKLAKHAQGVRLKFFPVGSHTYGN